MNGYFLKVTNEDGLRLTGGMGWIGRIGLGIEVDGWGG